MYVCVSARASVCPFYLFSSQVLVIMST